MNLDTLPSLVLIEVLSLMKYEFILEYRLLNKRINELILNSFLHLNLPYSSRKEEDEIEEEQKEFYKKHAEKVKEITYFSSINNLEFIEQFGNIGKLTLICTKEHLDLLNRLNQIRFKQLKSVNLILYDLKIHRNNVLNGWISSVLQNVENFSLELSDTPDFIVIPLLSSLNPNTLKELKIITRRTLEVNSYEAYICSLINLEKLVLVGDLRIGSLVNISDSQENKNVKIKEIILKGSLLFGREREEDGHVEDVEMDFIEEELEEEEEEFDTSMDITHCFLKDMIYQPSFKKLLVDLEDYELNEFGPPFFNYKIPDGIQINHNITSLGFYFRQGYYRRDFDLGMFTKLQQICIHHSELIPSLELINVLKNITSVVLINFHILECDWEHIKEDHKLENNHIKKLTLKDYTVVYKGGRLDLNVYDYDEPNDLIKRKLIEGGTPDTSFIKKPILLHLQHSSFAGDEGILSRLEENKYISINKI